MLICEQLTLAMLADPADATVDDDAAGFLFNDALPLRLILPLLTGRAFLPSGSTHAVVT